MKNLNYDFLYKDSLESYKHDLSENTRSYAIWKESNGQKFLEVYAPDYYTLGFLQGKQLANEIKYFKGIIKLIGLRYIFKKCSYDKFLNLAKIYENNIPESLKVEMVGMANAILDVSYRDILLQNCFLDILYGQIIPENKAEYLLGVELGCTSFGLINKNDTMIGQNFDYPFFFKPSAYFIHLITPEFGEFFSFRLGGVLAMPIGVNRNISVRVNVIKSNMKGTMKTPVAIRSRIGFEHALNVEQFYNIFIKEKMTSSGNLILSDKSKVIALEMLPDFHVRRDIDQQVVRSNTYVSESLQNYLIDQEYSKLRQDYSEKKLNDLRASKDNAISDLDLLSILSDSPIICRENPLKPMTLAFLTDKSFGLGTAKTNNVGMVPVTNGYSS